MINCLGIARVGTSTDLSIWLLYVSLNLEIANSKLIAIILILMSFSAFLSPISSTSVLAATPEVAEEYQTTGSIINLVNALYLLFMGLSPIFWGPLSQV